MPLALITHHLDVPAGTAEDFTEAPDGLRIGGIRPMHLTDGTTVEAVIVAVRVNDDGTHIEFDLQADLPQETIDRWQHWNNFFTAAQQQ